MELGVLALVEHVYFGGHLLPTSVAIVGNGALAALTLLGGDHDDAVGGTGAVDGCCRGIL